jgi:hypothetical protein
MGDGRITGDDWSPRRREFHGPLTQAQVDAVLHDLRLRFHGEPEPEDGTPAGA